MVYWVWVARAVQTPEEQLAQDVGKLLQEGQSYKALKPE